MGVVFDHFDLYWSGFLTSLVICLLALIGSLVLGTIIAAFLLVIGMRLLALLW